MRGRYILDSEQEALWSNWLAVTTPDVRDTDILAKFGSLSQGVKAQLAALHQTEQNFRSRLELLAASVVEMAGQSSQGQSVAVRFQEAQAAAMQEITAAVEVVGEQVSAFASAITALNATVGDTGAGALWRMAVSAGSGDVISRVELQVRASVGADWVAAATIWEAGITGGTPFGRILLSAMQTLIADGAGNVLALFDETGAYLDNARIRNLTATNITADKLDAAAVLQDGTLITDLIAINAISEFESIDYEFDSGNVGGVASYNEGGWTNHGTFIITKPADLPCIEFVFVEAFANLSGSGSRDAYIVLKRNGTGSINTGETVAQARRQDNGTTTVSQTLFRNNGETSIRYDIFTWNEYTVGGSSTVRIRTTCASGVWVFKR